jgi:hypothetical protein
LISYSDVDGVFRIKASVAGQSFSGYEPPQLKLSNSLTQVTLSGSSTIATAAIGGG